VANETNVDEAFRLSGADSPKALADTLTANWTEAVAALSRGEVEGHARDTLNDAQLADDIAEIAKDKSVSEDTRLFRVIMRLDARQNPEFMGYELSEQGLAELVAEVDGPFPTWSATSGLRILYTDHVLTLSAEATNTQRFRELDDRWHDEFEAWNKLTARSKEAGGPDIQSQSAWRNRAKVLGLLLDTKEEEGLRARAKEARAKPTVAEWSKEVSSLEGAGVGTLLGVGDLGPAADAYDDSRTTEKKAANSKRRNGVISGVVTVAIIGGIVFAVAVFASQKQQDITFGTTKPTVTASKSIDPATAAVIGTITINEDTQLLKEPKAGSEVVQELKKDDRVYQIGHDEEGFFLVRLASDEKVFGYMDKNAGTTICPVQCG
jgi:hypothetical protein